jgi:hypothetical protein
VQNVFGHGFSPIYKDIRWMPALLRLSFPLSADFGNVNDSTRGLPRTKAGDTGASGAGNADFVVIQMHLPQ